MADEMSYFSISLQPCSCITLNFIVASPANKIEIFQGFRKVRDFLGRGQRVNKLRANWAD